MLLWREKAQKITGLAHKDHELKNRLLANLSLLHPFLLSVAPILALYALNVREVSVGRTLLPIAVSLTFTIVAFIILCKVLKNGYKAALVVSVFLILFFSYGHLIDVINNISKFKYAQTIIFSVYVVLLLDLVLLILLAKGELVKLNKVLTVIVAVFIGISIFNITLNSINSNRGLKKAEENVTKTIEMEIGAASQLPDIYYIILDTYCRQDALEKIYGYDNSDFMGFLKDNDFYVAEESICNYTVTLPSLTSSLNMNYVQDIVNHETYMEDFQNSTLINVLKNNGYKIIEITSIWDLVVGLKDADLQVCYEPELDEFTRILIESTAFRFFYETDIPVRKKLLYQFSQVSRVKELIDGPRFIFAHTSCPHPPGFSVEKAKP